MTHTDDGAGGGGGDSTGGGAVTDGSDGANPTGTTPKIPGGYWQEVPGSAPSPTDLHTDKYVYHDPLELIGIPAPAF